MVATVAAAAIRHLKSGTLLVGACDWPSHQQVWAGYYTKAYEQCLEYNDLMFSLLCLLLFFFSSLVHKQYGKTLIPL